MKKEKKFFIPANNIKDLLTDIKVDFTEEVPFIWNRNHTEGCPVETMCSEVESAEEILPLIRDFLEKIRNKK